MKLSERLDNVFKAFAGVEKIRNNFYERDINGTQWNMENPSYEFLERKNFMSLFGGKTYLKPLTNYKEYYVTVSYLADCVDFVTNLIAQAEIYEVDKNGKVVENSPFMDFLNKPNHYQSRAEFIKEAFTNFYTSGLSLVYSDSFENGNLKKMSNVMFNLNYCNLEFPKIENPYELRKRDFEELRIKEKIGKKERKIKVKQLAWCYDIGKYGTYGEKGYSEGAFFNPISRITSIIPSIQTLINAEDSMAYISNSPVLGVLSKKNDPNAVAPLNGQEKADIEKKINGRGQYGTSVFGKGALIASNEEFSLLDLTPNVQKLQLVQLSNNAKENIRSRFNLSRDLNDAVSQGSRGATYENKQTAEALFIEGFCKGDLNKFLQSLMDRVYNYFDERGTHLECSFDHMPSVEVHNAEATFAGMTTRLQGIQTALVTYGQLKEVDESVGTFEDFLNKNGFDELLNH